MPSLDKLVALQVCRPSILLKTAFKKIPYSADPW